MLAVIVGAVVGGMAQYAFWAAAIVLDLAAAGVGGQLAGWNLHPDHFAERHGLIIIIALGETLIVAASGLVAAPATLGSLTTALLAVALTAALWWCYFRTAKPLFEHAMAAQIDSARSRLARDVFSVLHFPMLCGIIAMAAATEVALAHPHEPLEAGARLALGGGAVLFVCGSAAAMWRATGRLSPWRVGLMPVAAGLMVAVARLPLAAMGLLLVGLILLALVEHRPDSPGPAAMP
jgi:low temperature requirement protein LtrA